MLISLLSPWHLLLLPSCCSSTRTSTVCIRWGLSCVYIKQWPVILISLRIPKHQLRSLQASFMGLKCLLREMTSRGPLSQCRPDSFSGRCLPVPCSCFPPSCPHRFCLSQQGNGYGNWPKPSLAC